MGGKACLHARRKVSLKARTRILEKSAKASSYRLSSSCAKSRRKSLALTTRLMRVPLSKKVRFLHSLSAYFVETDVQFLHQDMANLKMCVAT